MLAVTLLALTWAASAPAAAAGGAAFAAADVPLPNLSPRTGAAPGAAGSAPDAIGDIINGDDTNEATSSEDSDTAVVGEPDPAPPPPPANRQARPVDAVGLKLALALLADNDPAGAELAIYALPDKIDIQIVEWLIATGSYSTVPSQSLADLRKKLPDWPAQGLMRLRYEQAIAREKPPAADVIKALGGSEPSSDSAVLLLAAAYRDTGRTKDAAALVRKFWREEDLSTSTETSLIANFGNLLTAADHKARLDRLLYDEKNDAALRTASHLDKTTQALAQAVTLVNRRSSKAAKALAALPASARRDPLYLYSHIRLLRRAGKITEAGNELAAAPTDPKVIVDPNAWWIERRLISRALAAAGNAKLAYRIAANHSTESRTLQAEAEFHAGWYALEFLHDPATAAKHFARIAEISSLPLSASRAEYWLGRAYEAAGQRDAAIAHYRNAAAYPTAFYGQLALAKLGAKTLGISQPPAPTADTIARFNGRKFVQVIRHLEAAGAGDRAGTFYRMLAQTLDDPAEVALLAQMSEQAGQYQVALQIGKFAAVRGLPVDTLAFPMSAIPASASTPTIERPLVFAIARQESAFNVGAVSGAGARGLLQLMPATAKSVAKSLGLSYSKGKLTSDPGYNATLGAAHLGSLVDDFGGSYVMTFAAYNAGSTRVAQWVKQFGDPRDPKVDVVDWIEQIPFTETRNYVQRILENLQVYRARLGQPTLAIQADLTRGAAQR